MTTPHSVLIENLTAEENRRPIDPVRLASAIRALDEALELLGRQRGRATLTLMRTRRAELRDVLEGE